MTVPPPRESRRSSWDRLAASGTSLLDIAELPRADAPYQEAQEHQQDLALGALGQRQRRTRIVAVFGVFEFLVPLTGIAIGHSVAGSLASTGRWIGAALLGALGIATLLAGLRDRSSNHWEQRAEIASGILLTFLAIGAAAGWL